MKPWRRTKIRVVFSARVEYTSASHGAPLSGDSPLAPAMTMEAVSAGGYSRNLREALWAVKSVGALRWFCWEAW